MRRRIRRPERVRTPDLPQVARTKKLLVFDGGGRSMAVPLSSVDRLEDVRAHDVETGRDGAVLQYRDALLPLLELGSGWAGASSRKVIVSSDDGVSIGVVVDRIVDVVEVSDDDGGDDVDIVVGGRVTSVVDPCGLARAHGVLKERTP